VRDVVVPTVVVPTVMVPLVGVGIPSRADSCDSPPASDLVLNDRQGTPGARTAGGRGAPRSAVTATLAVVNAPPSQPPNGTGSPPPLPPVNAGLAHIVVPATAIWFIGFVVLLFFVGDLRAHDALIWLWTFLAGWVLGFIGLSVYAWQRHAARRGARGSSSMALDEKF